MSWIDLRQPLPWLQGTRVHVVAADREPALRAALAADAFRVLTLDGRAVLDASGFFAAAAEGCGFPPHFGSNWDAFRDALGDLADGPSPRVALLWTGADIFVRSDLGTFVTAVTTLDDVARDLAATVQLEIFLLSHGPGAV